eukprot:gene18019-19823_t
MAMIHRVLSSVALIQIAICISHTEGHLHQFDDAGHKHSLDDDHSLFLGQQLKDEFDSLTMDESKRRLRLLIPHIDLNKDGFVSFDEMETWITHKMKRFEIKEDAQALYRESDRNFDEQVTWDEFCIRQYGFLETDDSGIAEAGKKNFFDLIIRDKRRWKYADVDKNNMLNQTEFEYFRHPWEHEVMMRVVAMEELEEADIDKDGYLSMKEYTDSIHLPEMRLHDEKEFREKHDKNHDGKLDLDEVEDWKRPEDFNRASLETKHLIDIADDNKDGKLSSDEIISNHMVFVGSVATQHGQVLHDEF